MVMESHTTVQMPLNVMDVHFRSFGHLGVPELAKQQIGVLGMKKFGDNVILKSGVPLTPADMLHFLLNLPTSVVITGIDNEKVLDQAFEATRSFRPMSADQVAAMAEKTRQFAMEGKYELFKKSSYFDTTAKHPDFLGGLTPTVEDMAPGPAS